LRSAIHHHLGAALRHSLIVGNTHQDLAQTGALPGPEPVPFFVPIWTQGSATSSGRRRACGGGSARPGAASWRRCSILRAAG